MTLRFSDRILQVCIAIMPEPELADLDARDAVSRHLLHRLAVEFRIVPVRIFRHHAASPVVERIFVYPVFSTFDITLALRRLDVRSPYLTAGRQYHQPRCAAYLSRRPA